MKLVHSSHSHLLSLQEFQHIVWFSTSDSGIVVCHTSKLDISITELIINIQISAKITTEFQILSKAYCSMSI